jgi:cytochrome o ubiquinol oxidase operon protein cyoD
MTSETDRHASETDRHGLEYEEDDKGGASDEHSAHLTTYVLGLGLATLLTVASFWVAKTHLIYDPGIPMALATLAVAQMGIHLVFFLHLTTAPDNTNNILALAFGLLIVGLVIFGSVWIMAHLTHNMMPMQQLIQMQR